MIPDATQMLKIQPAASLQEIPDGKLQLALNILNGIPCNWQTDLRNLLRHCISLVSDREMIRRLGIALHVNYGAGMCPEPFAEELELTPSNCRHLFLEQLASICTSRDRDCLEALFRLWNRMDTSGSFFNLILEAAKTADNPDHQAFLLFYTLEHPDAPVDSAKGILAAFSEIYPRCSYPLQVNCFLSLLSSRKTYSDEILDWAWQSILEVSSKQPVVYIPIVFRVFEYLTSALDKNEKESIYRLFDKHPVIMSHNGWSTAKATCALVEYLSEIFDDEIRLQVLKTKIGLNVLLSYSSHFQEKSCQIIYDEELSRSIPDVFFACFEDNAIGRNQAYSIICSMAEQLKIDVTRPANSPQVSVLEKKPPLDNNKMRFHWIMDAPKMKSYDPRSRHLVESIFKVNLSSITDKKQITNSILAAAVIFNGEMNHSQKIRLKEKAIRFYLKLSISSSLSENDLREYYAEQFVRLFDLRIEHEEVIIRELLFTFSNQYVHLHQPYVVGNKVRAVIHLWNALSAKSKAPKPIAPILLEMANRQRCVLNAAFGFLVPLSEIDHSPQVCQRIAQLMKSDEVMLSHCMELCLIILKGEELIKDPVLMVLESLSKLRSQDLKGLIPLLQAILPHCERHQDFCLQVRPLIFEILMKPVDIDVEEKKHFNPASLGFINALPGYFSLSSLQKIVFKDLNPGEIEFLRTHLEHSVFLEQMHLVRLRMDFLNADQILGYFHFFKNIYDKLAQSETIYRDSMAEAWKSVVHSVENWHNRIIDINSIMMDET